MFYGAAVSACSVLAISNASAASILSAAQQKVISKGINELKAEEERTLANGWPDAKKVAELICRPLALTELKRSFKEADRVFLGTDDPATLVLESDELLTGTGEVRAGDDWIPLKFACGLNPETGAATSFEAIPTTDGRQ
ncbi:hypothetical protein ABID21_001909 [Pseudorhizobium tarimense]|uniref:DUF930 domain-containing protein n=1 Tax=Pseudorhizobium tarimense TaxID=1079109 RepID=A0ABV2H5H9_9HYPH|nr:hypothetical protein [Pseudorhizobium tarimense]MCJ8519002.1 hypothetical protein [Pseudorhizobium tarimense]